MKKKSYILITDVNFPFGGASANFLRLFTKGVVENNQNIKVILQRGKQYGNSKVFLRNGVINNVHYKYCCFTNRPRNYFLKLIDDIIGIILPCFFILKYFLKKEIDSVIMYNSNAYFSIFTVFLCKLLSIPIFNFVVEWYDYSHVKTKKKITKLNEAFFLAQVKTINFHYNGLIVLSSFLKKYYVDNKFGENKILIQPNFVDLIEFETNFEQPMNNIVRIGYCGTPTKKDGIDDLLIAFSLVFSRNKNTELLIIGDSTSNISLIPDLMKKAVELGISKNLTFSGLVDYEKVLQLLQTCNILVLARPSGIFAEAGFPTKLGEYLICKKPVVITKVGDIPLYFKDGFNAMLAEPDNPQSVADKIEFLIENPKTGIKIAENGFNWAKENLEYKMATRKIIEFMENGK